MAHARRKFIEVEKAAPEIAREAVALLCALFAVEKQAKEVSVAERWALRQAQDVWRFRDTVERARHGNAQPKTIFP